jgi:hypothetical protein
MAWGARNLIFTQPRTTLNFHGGAPSHVPRAGVAALVAPRPRNGVEGPGVAERPPLAALALLRAAPEAEDVGEGHQGLLDALAGQGITNSPPAEALAPPLCSFLERRHFIVRRRAARHEPRARRRRRPHGLIGAVATIHNTIADATTRNEAPVRGAPEELLATGARGGAGLVASHSTVAGVVVDARARNDCAVGAAVAVYVVLLAPERHPSYIGVAVRGARLRRRGDGVQEW